MGGEGGIGTMDWWIKNVMILYYICDVILKVSFEADNLGKGGMTFTSAKLSGRIRPYSNSQT